MSNETPKKSAAVAALVSQQATLTAATGNAPVNSRNSVVLQNVLRTDGDEAEKPRKLYEGSFELTKPGYPPFPLSHLIAVTAGDETLVLLSSKPQVVSHCEAAEQIVQFLSIIPTKFLYLHRVFAGPEGTNHGLCRDLVTEYAFAWERGRGAWHAASESYCYRVSPQVEVAIQHLLRLREESLNFDVVDVPL